MAINLKRLLANVVGSAGARGINLLIALAQVPLLVSATAADEYAVLAMTISLSIFAAYADLGIGLAIVNTIAGINGSQSTVRAQRAVSIAWFFLLSVALAIIAIVTVSAMTVSVLVNPENHFRYYAMLMGVGLVAIGLPTGLVQRILLAKHQIGLANAWTTSAKLLSLICLWLLVDHGHTDLYLLVFSILGIPVIVGWISVLALFASAEGRMLAPRYSLVRRKPYKHYALLGFSFLTMQMVPYIELGIDSILVGTLVSLMAVQPFDVYSKLYSYLPALVSIAVLPIWPLITQAKKNGDLAAIKKLTKWFYLYTTLFAFSGGVLMLIFDTWIVEKWIGRPIDLSFEIRLGLAIFGILACIGYVQSMILNGLGAIHQQAKLYVGYILFLLAAKIILCAIYGIIGLVVALNVAYLVRIMFSMRLQKTAFLEKNNTGLRL